MCKWMKSQASRNARPHLEFLFDSLALHLVLPLHRIYWSERAHHARDRYVTSLSLVAPCATSCATDPATEQQRKRRERMHTTRRTACSW
jgi:hypothetical protein